MRRARRFTSATAVNGCSRRPTPSCAASMASPSASTMRARPGRAQTAARWWASCASARPHRLRMRCRGSCCKPNRPPARAASAGSPISSGSTPRAARHPLPAATASMPGRLRGWATRPPTTSTGASGSSDAAGDGAIVESVTGSQTFPVVLSLRVALTALLVVAPIGIALAWLQARRRYPGRGLVDAVVLLPLVLPPSVVGVFLEEEFGRFGVIGRWLYAAFGLRLGFTPTAAVIASCVVALPILVKTAQPALEGVPPELEKVGRSLGLAPLALFFRVTLPAAWRGVAAALVLAFARAIGEFGATLMFAGNIPGRTNTMPLEIFAAYQAGDDRRALLYVSVLSAISGVVVLVAARLTPREVPA